MVNLCRCVFHISSICLTLWIALLPNRSVEQLHSGVELSETLGSINQKLIYFEKQITELKMRRKRVEASSVPPTNFTEIIPNLAEDEPVRQRTTSGRRLLLSFLCLVFFCLPLCVFTGHSEEVLYD